MSDRLQIFALAVILAAGAGRMVSKKNYGFAVFAGLIAICGFLAVTA